MGEEKGGVCETIDSGGGCFQDHGMNDIDYVLRQWDLGERQLAAGRYVAAQRMLEAAERGAWEARDWVRLARIYLPLLEARRQIRQNAAEGTIVITSVGDRVRMRGVVRAFAREEAGTLLLDVARAEVGLRWAREVRYAALRTGHLIEAMLLLRQGGEVRVVSPGEAVFAGGLAVEWTADEGRMIGASTERGTGGAVAGGGEVLCGGEGQRIACGGAGVADCGVGGAGVEMAGAARGARGGGGGAGVVAAGAGGGSSVRAGGDASDGAGGGGGEAGKIVGQALYAFRSIYSLAGAKR